MKKIGDEMNKALEAALNILQGRELSFSDLTRNIIGQTHVDEATAKAAIYRLNSEGRRLEITFDWSVRSLHRTLEVVAAEFN
jgi:hypothetical protein